MVTVAVATVVGEDVVRVVAVAGTTVAVATAAAAESAD